MEEGTPFYEAYEKGELDLPREEVEREMYYLTMAYLKEHGYERYEISNYAKPGRECIHNIGYWQRKNYVGFGVGAASLIENQRFSNGEDLLEYMQNPCECVVNHQRLSMEEQMEEYMFLGLRMSCGVSQKEFYSCFGKTMKHVYGHVIQKHIRNGLLEGVVYEEEERIRLTDAGMDVSNLVMADFLEPDL